MFHLKRQVLVSSLTIVLELAYMVFIYSAFTGVLKITEEQLVIFKPVRLSIQTRVKFRNNYVHAFVC